MYLLQGKDNLFYVKNIERSLWTYFFYYKISQLHYLAWENSFNICENYKMLVILNVHITQALAKYSKISTFYICTIHLSSQTDFVVHYTFIISIDCKEDLLCPWFSFYWNMQKIFYYYIHCYLDLGGTPTPQSVRQSTTMLLLRCFIQQIKVFNNNLQDKTVSRALPIIIQLLWEVSKT